MRRKKTTSPARRSTSHDASAGRDPVGLRIIGGRLRGRKLQYGGDSGVRPMKDRVREALFNLLGRDVVGKHAVDLFAGTGALALEAISRGAVGATFIERHHPTARVLRENIATLGLDDVCRVVIGSVFLRSAWAPGLPGVAGPVTAAPCAWLVFCSPPYAFYVEREGEMLALVGDLAAAAPPASVIVVESDERFDFAKLAHVGAWRTRDYPPARIGIYEKPPDAAVTPLIM